MFKLSAQSLSRILVTLALVPVLAGCSAGMYSGAVQTASTHTEAQEHKPRSADQEKYARLCASNMSWQTPDEPSFCKEYRLKMYPSRNNDDGENKNHDCAFNLPQLADNLKDDVQYYATHPGLNWSPEFVLGLITKTKKCMGLPDIKPE